MLELTPTAVHNPQQINKSHSLFNIRPICINFNKMKFSRKDITPRQNEIVRYNRKLLSQTIKRKTFSLTDFELVGRCTTILGLHRAVKSHSLLKGLILGQ